MNELLAGALALLISAMTALVYWVRAKNGGKKEDWITTKRVEELNLALTERIDRVIQAQERAATELNYLNRQIIRLSAVLDQRRRYEDESSDPD